MISSHCFASTPRPERRNKKQGMLQFQNMPWTSFHVLASGFGGRKMDTKIVVALLIVATLLLLVNYFPSPLWFL